MTWNPPADASRDRSILITLARLLKAGKHEWLATDEVKDLIGRLQMPESRRIAVALLDPKKHSKLSAEEKHDFSYVEDLAALK